MIRLLKSLLADSRGATAIEYGLLAALISVAMITGLSGFSDALTNIFGAAGNGMASVQ